MQAQQIQWVSRARLDAEQMWIDNWLSILPYIAAHAELLDAALIEQVVHQCRVPTRLEAIEWQHARLESVLVRTAVFVALQRGRLSAPILRDRRWDLKTEFVISGRARHASQGNP